MNRSDLRNLAGRYGAVAFLAAIAATTVWYIAGEDARVGKDYGRIFHQNPSLMPADLTSLAALHIQTAAMIAQMCVTIGLALAFSRIPRPSSDQPDEMVIALWALTEAVNKLGQVPTPIPTERPRPEPRDRMGGDRQAGEDLIFLRNAGTTSIALPSSTTPSVQSEDVG